MRKRTRERLDWLEKALAGGGTIHLSEAAERWGVSEMTIRRDIEASQGELSLLAGRILMTHDPRYAPVYDLTIESASHRLAKQRIAREAARWIEADDTLFVDCGTTLIHLAAALDPNVPLTVMTYALNVCNVFSALPNVRLLMLGGFYHASSQSFSGEEITRVLDRVAINKAFISAAGVHRDRGVSCFHFHEVGPKQAALKAAQQRFLVADDSKHQKVRPALFGQWDDFDVFITSGEADTAWAAASKRAGPRIVWV